MRGASDTELVRRKFDALADDLDERARRRWAAAEAKASGRGGLDALIEPAVRGSPVNPLRRACESTRRPAEGRRRQGFAAAAPTVRRSFRHLGYSLHANRKTRGRAASGPGRPIPAHPSPAHGPEAAARAAAFGGARRRRKCRET